MIYRYRIQTVLTTERLCSNSRMRTESRWIQTNTLHRQDNTAQHSRPFPAGSYLAPRGKGATTTATMEWKKDVCDSSDERLLTIALLFCWLFGSSPSLVQSPTYLPCHWPTTQISQISSLTPNYCFIILFCPGQTHQLHNFLSPT